MAAMITADRQAVSAQFQSDICQARDAFGAVLQADIDAAAAATDDWIVANQASFVAALPAAFRTASTTAQKVQMFVTCLQRRFKVGA